MVPDWHAKCQHRTVLRLRNNQKGVYPMTVERWLRLIAGSLILASATLAAIHSPYWLLFTGFVGLNLAQSAFTNWCPMMTILRKLGVPDCRTPPVR